MNLPTPYFRENNITLYHGDALELLPFFSATSIDMILTDPPYWTLNKWREVGTTTRLGGNNDPDKRSGWFDTIDEIELFDFMCECFRILRKDTHAYIMGDGQVLKWLLGYAEEAGFANYKPIPWDKVNQGMGYHYRCRHEYFVMLDKGKNRKLNNLSTPDIWTEKAIRGEIPTEKPVSLMEIPIVHSTNSGDVVLDPFLGGGSSAIAAIRHDRKFIGIEKNEQHLQISIKRIKTAMLDKHQEQGNLL